MTASSSTTLGQTDAALDPDAKHGAPQAGRHPRYHNDMDTYSLAAAARALRTSAPRVRRAIDRLGMPVERNGSGVFRLTQGQVDELSSVLGVAPSVPDLSPTQARVLAALSRSPRGVASVREAARRAGTSPTATARALARLEYAGLIMRTHAILARGRATEATVYQVPFASPRWLALAPAIAQVRLPSRSIGRTPQGFPRICSTCSGMSRQPSLTSRVRRRSSPGG